jgi:hypothetical protein
MKNNPPIQDDMTTMERMMTSPIPIAPITRYGCGSDRCVTCYGNLAWRRENLPYYWLEARFDEDGLCPECGHDLLDHDADGTPGNFTYTCPDDDDEFVL